MGQVFGVVLVAGQAISQTVDPGRVLRDDLFPGRRNPGLARGARRLERMLRNGAVPRGCHVIIPSAGGFDTHDASRPTCELAGYGGWFVSAKRGTPSASSKPRTTRS